MGVSPIEFQALRGPEVGALRGKAIRPGSFPGPGGQLNAECRMGNWRKEARNFAFRIDQHHTIRPLVVILFPPMLLPHSALTSGPQACFFAEMKSTEARKVRGA